MAFVIARHLYKSGGNDIIFRIGQYNKRSKREYEICRNIAKCVVSSERYITFQKNIKHSRDIDKLCNLYVCIERKPIELMAKIYSKEIIKKIIKNSSSRKEVIKNGKWGQQPKTYMKYFLAAATKIIHKNTKYRSMDLVLKHYNNSSQLEVLNAFYLKYYDFK